MSERRKQPNAYIHIGVAGTNDNVVWAYRGFDRLYTQHDNPY